MSEPFAEAVDIGEQLEKIAELCGVEYRSIAHLHIYPASASFHVASASFHVYERGPDGKIHIAEDGEPETQTITVRVFT